MLTQPNIESSATTQDIAVLDKKHKTKTFRWAKSPIKHVFLKVQTLLQKNLEDTQRAGEFKVKKKFTIIQVQIQ